MCPRFVNLLLSEQKEFILTVSTRQNIYYSFCVTWCAFLRIKNDGSRSLPSHDCPKTFRRMLMMMRGRQAVALVRSDCGRHAKQSNTNNKRRWIGHGYYTVHTHLLRLCLYALLTNIYTYSHYMTSNNRTRAQV